jgi:hypothetical protein
VKDFSIEKSFESFCTDSTMRSDYEEKLAEAMMLSEGKKLPGRSFLK